MILSCMKIVWFYVQCFYAEWMLSELQWRRHTSMQVWEHGNTGTLDSSAFENKSKVFVKSRYQNEFWSLGLPQRGSQSSTKMSWSTIVQCKEFKWMLDACPTGTSSLWPHQSPGECVSLAVAAFCRFIKATAKKSACVWLVASLCAGTACCTYKIPFS